MSIATGIGKSKGILMAIVAAASFVSGIASAQDLPVPPCAGEPNPAPGAVGESLNQLVWIDDDSLANWVPPACTGWTAGPTRALLAASGRFDMEGSSDVLASRLARISQLNEMIYWSSTRNRWRNLFRDATALSSPDEDARRADFSDDELVPGAEFYFWLEEDNPTAGVVYQVIAHERTPDRLVYETVNLTPIAAKLLFIRRAVAAEGEFRQLYFIERESGSTWRFYILVRMGDARSLTGTTEANYRNRAEAYFRYIAGLPMDREPPAAR